MINELVDKNEDNVDNKINLGERIDKGYFLIAMSNLCFYRIKLATS